MESLGPEEVERLRGIYEPLAQSVRALLDATIRAPRSTRTPWSPPRRDRVGDGTFAGQATPRCVRVFTDFHLGAAYEGPPGNVHGGISAMVLDHALGEAASDGEKPRLTGTITLRYVCATRLGQLHAEAGIVRTDGVKTFAVGHLADDEGVTVEADGVFIKPKWCARLTSCRHLVARRDLRQLTSDRVDLRNEHP